MTPWIVLISGLYFVMFSFIQNTGNMLSALIYKIIPFVLGSSCVIIALGMFGWVTLNI